MGHAADLHQKGKGLARQKAMRPLVHSSIMMSEIALIENASQHSTGRSAIAGRGIVKGHDAGRTTQMVNGQSCKHRPQTAKPQMVDIMLQAAHINRVFAAGTVHIEETHPVGYLTKANTASHVVAGKMHEDEDGIEVDGRQGHIAPSSGFLFVVVPAPCGKAAAKTRIEVGDHPAVQLDNHAVETERALIASFLLLVAPGKMGREEAHGPLKLILAGNEHIHVARHAVSGLRITLGQALSLEQPGADALSLQHGKETPQTMVHLAVGILGIGRGSDQREIDGLGRTALQRQPRERIGKKALAGLGLCQIGHLLPRGLIGPQERRSLLREVGPQSTAVELHEKLFSPGKSTHNRKSFSKR